MKHVIRPELALQVIPNWWRENYDKRCEPKLAGRQQEQPLGGYIESYSHGSSHLWNATYKRWRNCIMLHFISGPAELIVWAIDDGRDWLWRLLDGLVRKLAYKLVTIYLTQCQRHSWYISHTQTYLNACLWAKENFASLP